MDSFINNTVCISGNMSHKKIEERGLNRFRSGTSLQDNSGDMIGWFLCLMAYQPLLGYLMPKLFSKKNSSGTT